MKTAWVNIETSLRENLQLIQVSWVWHLAMVSEHVPPGEEDRRRKRRRGRGRKGKEKNKEEEEEGHYSLSGHSDSEYKVSF